MRFDLITPVEAAGIKHYLVNEREKGRGKLKPSSANRAISAIKPVFQFAIDCGYLTVSPFAKVKGGESSSLENTEYISLQRIEDAFAACGNHLEYQSLLAIARYEGLRVPSEIRALKFSDFRNFETGIIFTVPDSGKTGKRRIPVFVEFLPYLEELQKHRKEGQVELFERCRKGTNVGTLIRERIAKTGLPLWYCFLS